MNPYNRKLRNIARAFATDRDFNLTFSEYIRQIGFTGAGSRHLTYDGKVTNIDMYPRGIYTLNNIRFEIDLVLRIDEQNMKYFLLYVEEYPANVKPEVAKLETNYIISFRAPQNLADLKGIQFSEFEYPRYGHDDAGLTIASGLGNNFLTISKEGMANIAKIEKQYLT